MTRPEVAPALSAELRAILDEADTIRLRMQTEVIEEREWLERALARIETATRRLLHLVAG